MPYLIRINDDGLVMEYKTDSYTFAIKLFETLKTQKAFCKVQVFNNEGVLKLETVWPTQTHPAPKGALFLRAPRSLSFARIKTH